MFQESDILSELFDSPARVRALKLFLRNPSEAFTIGDGAKRLRLLRRDFLRQVKKFSFLDLVRSKVMHVAKKPGGRTRKEAVYYANPKFVFYNELRGLVTKSSPTAWDKKLPALKRLGRVKLAVIGGHLVNDEKARADVLLVGDKLNSRSVSTFMRNLEADVGKDLRYLVLSVQEFLYRFNMFDNVLRDILERPHRKLVNKLKQTLGD